MPITIINSNYKIPKDDNRIVVNTTSRSTNWSRGLSPFILGPCDLYDGYKSVTMENGWQFSKIFEYYLNDDGSIGERYFNWAKKGWADSYAHRYPMGRDARPICSYWDGERLDYVSARKKIYIPLYSKAVAETKAFAMLQQTYEKEKDIYLWDFDAHNLQPGTFQYQKLINNPNVKVGHAYVLAMMLEGDLK